MDYRRKITFFVLCFKPLVRRGKGYGLPEKNHIFVLCFNPLVRRGKDPSNPEFRVQFTNVIFLEV
jgi:hypothetical protein